VNGVIEEDEIRQIVNTDPGDGLAACPTVTDRLKQLCVRPYLRVTVDAGLGGRDACVARFLNSCMTVLALKSQALNMVLVAEGHWLFGTLTLPRHPGGTLQLIERYSQGDHNQPSQYEAHSSQRIGAAVKDLRHSFSCWIFAFACGRCADGHICCVQKSILDAKHPKTRGSSKIKYTSRPPLRKRLRRKFQKNSCVKSTAQLIDN
jgi:hypothetical protein